jgi:hypothetical protein
MKLTVLNFLENQLSQGSPNTSLLHTILIHIRKNGEDKIYDPKEVAITLKENGYWNPIPKTPEQTVTMYFSMNKKILPGLEVASTF